MRSPIGRRHLRAGTRASQRQLSVHRTSPAFLSRFTAEQQHLVPSSPLLSTFKAPLGSRSDRRPSTGSPNHHHDCQCGGSYPRSTASYPR